MNCSGHRPQYAMEINGIKFYGGTKHLCSVHHEFDAVINLTGEKRFDNREILLDWPDFGVYPAGRYFWKRMLRKLKRLGIRRVLICCAGGHGRTGTCLGALLVASGFRGDATKRVREAYCQTAIETTGQVQYLRDLAGWQGWLSLLRDWRLRLS